MHGCGAIHWSVGKLPVIIDLKKADSRSLPPSLSTVNSSPARGGVLWAPPPSVLEGWPAWSCVRSHSCCPVGSFSLEHLYKFLIKITFQGTLGRILTPNRELWPALSIEPIFSKYFPASFPRSFPVKASLSGKKQDWQCYLGKSSCSSQRWQQAASVFLGTSSILWHSDMCQPLGFSRAPSLGTLPWMEISLSSPAVWVMGCLEVIGQKTREPELWGFSFHPSQVPLEQRGKLSHNKQCFLPWLTW